MAETTVYLEIEPEWSQYAHANGDPRLSKIKVTRALQNRPRRIGGVVVAVRLRIPDAAFLPLRPTVTVEVPEAALAYEPEVTVELPDGGPDA